MNSHPRMETVILTPAFTADANAMLPRLALSPGSEEADEFRELLESVAPLTRPKAAVGEATVDKVGEDGEVMIGGIVFRSRLLARLLWDEPVVWPFLATCGREIHEQADAVREPLARYWLDEIMREALTTATDAAEAYVAAHRFPGKTATVSPGSLDEWPIEEQLPLFALLGDAPGRCGVVLTEHLLMLPGKTVSGIRFHNEHGHVNCRLCPREGCRDRRAAYCP